MGGTPGGEGHGDEFLIVLDLKSSAADLERLRRSYRITHVGSPRLVVIALSPGQTPPSPLTPGVVAATGGGTLPAEVVDGLDEREALFVAAWESRLAGQQKQRRGEGLSWGASGFEPPDPPTGTSISE